MESKRGAKQMAASRIAAVTMGWMVLLLLAVPMAVDARALRRPIDAKKQAPPRNLVHRLVFPVGLSVAATAAITGIAGLLAYKLHFKPKIEEETKDIAEKEVQKELKELQEAQAQAQQAQKQKVVYVQDREDMPIETRRFYEAEVERRKREIRDEQQKRRDGCGQELVDILLNAQFRGASVHNPHSHMRLTIANLMRHPEALTGLLSIVLTTGSGDPNTQYRLREALRNIVALEQAVKSPKQLEEEYQTLTEIQKNLSPGLDELVGAGRRARGRGGRPQGGR